MPVKKTTIKSALTPKGEAKLNGVAAKKSAKSAPQKDILVKAKAPVKKKNLAKKLTASVKPIKKVKPSSPAVSSPVSDESLITQPSVVEKETNTTKSVKTILNQSNTDNKIMTVNKTPALVQKESDRAKQATSTESESVLTTAIKAVSVYTKVTAGGGPAGFLPYKVSEDEGYMSERQLAHFQHVLNLWKEQLIIDRGAATQHMRDDTVNFPDPLDRAALEEEHTLEWRAREREHRLIAKIDQALATIKQGDYGYCEACGAEIGIRRLEARPTATQCIDCKTIHEIREKNNGTLD